jgi:hypothetical protein
VNIVSLFATARIYTFAATDTHTRLAIKSLLERLARERLQSAAILGEVTQRLGEMAGYLSDANHANRSRFEDTQSYNDTVMSQVRALSDEVGSARSESRRAHRWRGHGVRPRRFCAVPRQAGRQEFMRRGLGAQGRPRQLS